jgi:hypothetical protein
LKKIKIFLKKLLNNKNTLTKVIIIFSGLLRIFLNNCAKINLFYNLFINTRQSKILKISIIGPIHSPHLKNFLITINNNFKKKYKINFQLINSDPNSYVHNFNINYQIIDKGIYYLLGYRSNYDEWLENIFNEGKNILENYTKSYLRISIYKYKPDIIWIHDLQSAGYLIESDIFWLRRELSNIKICCSIWGNDLYYFYEDNLHLKRLKSILLNIDFLHAESYRDEKIARSIGYKGIMLPVCSVTLNNIDFFARLNQYNLSDSKKDIYVLIKGSYFLRTNMIYFYDQLSDNHEFWKEKKIVIIGATSENIFFLRKLKNRHFLNLEIYGSMSHEMYLSFLRRSRYHLSCNLSDGIPNTVPEAVYSNCIPLFTNHTGLVDLLPIDIKNHISYDLETVDYFILFNNLDSNKYLHYIILKELKYIFEFKVFNRNIYDDIFIKLNL